MHPFDSTCFILGITPAEGERLILAGDFPHTDGHGWTDGAIDAWILAHGGASLPAGGGFRSPHLAFVCEGPRDRYRDASRRGAAAGGTGSRDGAAAGVAWSAAYAAWCRRMEAVRRFQVWGVAERGEYQGDGIPRTLDGTPYEPLDRYPTPERAHAPKTPETGP